MLEAEVDLDERTPLGPLGLADEMQAGFERSAIGLARITLDARADDVFPRRRAAAIAGNDVIQVQVLAVEDVSTVLAGVPVALKDVVPGELDFLLRQAVEEDKQDDAGNADPERDRVDAFRMRFLLGEVMPLAEIESLEGAVGAVEDDLGAALEQERESPLCRADIHRLPKAV